jgi:chaperone required for assembly of F1-ATPase
MGTIHSHILKNNAKSLSPDFMDEDYEFVITLDGETVKRLACIGRHLGVPPREVAAKLLRDILSDDALIEAGLMEPTSLQ